MTQIVIAQFCKLGRFLPTRISVALIKARGQQVADSINLAFKLNIACVLYNQTNSKI
jgi:hypothetical protein